MKRAVDMVAIVGSVTTFPRSGSCVVLCASTNRNGLLNIPQEQKDGYRETECRQVQA